MVTPNRERPVGDPGMVWLWAVWALHMLALAETPCCQWHRAFRLQHAERFVHAMYLGMGVAFAKGDAR